MMPQADDDRSMPSLSDSTAVDVAGPFDSTGVRRHTQLSDPPTAIVRRDSFRELPPGTIVGETYEIDARLGAGAMGEVYAARHVGLGKRVAIKVIGRRLSNDDMAMERFTMEARTLAQIQHPAIVAVEHVGELADGRAYFVMEFLRGESLFERMQRGRIALPEALRILDQMARGLEAAHGQGVVHRDLKPENTFLVHLPGEPPTIKLLDFGLAKFIADRDDIDRRPSRTQSGVAIGTPMYMSPEQARGPDVDYRTDIYALGCVAYELLLGVPPFPHAVTTPELYVAHLAEAPPLPRSIWPEIPPQLDLALFAMLAKDPAHRPTLAQVRAVIAAARSEPSQRAATEFVGPRVSRAAHRQLLIGMLGLLAIAIGISIGARLITPTHEQTSIPIKAPTVAVPAPVQTPAHVPSTTPKTPVALSTDDTSASETRPTSRKTSPKQGLVKTPKTSSNGSAATPIDAGINARSGEAVAPQGPPATSLDRDQTINPFAKKHPKVTP